MLTKQIVENVYEDINGLVDYLNDVAQTATDMDRDALVRLSSSIHRSLKRFLREV